jgi:cytochrome o ubiquinol oxidase operon protein cyoD
METGRADHAADRGDVKSYVAGFLLSVLLTVAAFWAVMRPGTPRIVAIAVILVLAAAQVLVHLAYFLHMSLRRDNRWNVISFAFTLLILVLIVGGSVWIMTNMLTTLAPPPSVMPGL